MAREIRRAAKKEKKIKSGSDASEAGVKEIQPKSEAAAPKTESSSEKKSKSKKRSSVDATTGDGPPDALEAKPKKSKKSKSTSEGIEIDKAPVAGGTYKSAEERKVERRAQKKAERRAKAKATLQPPPESIKEAVQENEVPVKKAEKRLDKTAKATEEVQDSETSSKKRKRSKDEEEVGPSENGKPQKAHKKKRAEEPAPPSEKQPEKLAVASSKHTSGAEQWNPEALSGDAARREKFLRLLGAGKAGVLPSSQHKSHTDTASISKVQSELERQYEAGMKHKHDGGSKRRGLGA